MRSSLGRSWRLHPIQTVAGIGLLCAGIAFVTLGTAGSDHQAPEGLATPSSYLLVVVTAPASALPTHAAVAIEPNALPGGPIVDGYRIEVPRLGIDLPVHEGDFQRDIDEQRTPEGYAFHLPGTSIPGQGGNTFLYAHARPGMFLALWSVRTGDVVRVRLPGGSALTYAIGEIMPRVAPTDVSTTLPTASERLTLQTSTGPNPADPRFIVVAFPRTD